jgi:hypothetical protein
VTPRAAGYIGQVLQLAADRAARQQGQEPDARSAPQNPRNFLAEAIEELADTLNYLRYAGHQQVVCAARLSDLQRRAAVLAAELMALYDEIAEEAS